MTKGSVGGLLLILAGSLLMSCSSESGKETADASMQAAQQVPSDPVSAGRLEEARVTGELIGGLEAGKGWPKRWDEQLDGGDDPLTPGCACQHQQADCGGALVGRAVDECYPRDGVTLQEKTIPTDCGHYGNKEYNCEKLLGKGARCKLIELDCCGVATTSGYCSIDVEP